MKKANNPGNLVPFKKGDPRINREGRPLKLPDLDHIMIKVLNETNSGGLTRMERIVRKLSEKAEAGDVRAAELVQDRAYGRLKTAASFDVQIENLSDENLIKICDRLFNNKNNETE
jgi:ribosomal protein S20